MEPTFEISASRSNTATVTFSHWMYLVWSEPTVFHIFADGMQRKTKKHMAYGNARYLFVKKNNVTTLFRLIQCDRKNCAFFVDVCEVVFKCMMHFTNCTSNLMRTSAAEPPKLAVFRHLREPLEASSVIKRGLLEAMNHRKFGDFPRNLHLKRIFHCHVWLPEGIISKEKHCVLICFLVVQATIPATRSSTLSLTQKEKCAAILRVDLLVGLCVKICSEQFRNPQIYSQIRKRKTS